jgi:hypothetical protein
MKLFRRLGSVTVLLLVAACDRSKAPPPVESTAAKPLSPAESVVVATTRSWNMGAGLVLLVEGGSPMQAFVVAPDSATGVAQLAALPRPASVTLFGRNGTVQTADLPAVADSNGCAVATLRSAPRPKPWNVGFIGGVVAPIALDSMTSLSAADSAALSIEVTRLASGLPNDSAGRFAGLPFVVKSLWRYSSPEGAPVVIATLTRQINQEATPLQEHTLLIAERGDSDSTFTTAYSERSFGDEETIESRDVLAVAMLGAARTTALILSRDYGDATAYGVVERDEDGRWRPRWRSARRRC